ncbi:MAG: hypothetical protein IKE28_01295 [Solobacterium sp.]|nr:hypothetical protein [Solobacterium sp.]
MKGSDNSNASEEKLDYSIIGAAIKMYRQKNGMSLDDLSEYGLFNAYNDAVSNRIFFVIITKICLMQYICHWTSSFNDDSFASFANKLKFS